MIVLDSSAALSALLNPNAWSARRLEAATRVHAPHLIELEVASALQRLVRQRRLSASRAEQVLADLLRLPLRRHRTTALLPRIWQLCGNLTPYDASYVALAERLGLPLVTVDRRLARAPGHQARIETP